MKTSVKKIKEALGASRVLKVDDRQFYEQLQLNGRLIDLGDKLILAIERFGGPKSLNMQEAVRNWKAELREKYTKTPDPRDAPEKK